MSAVLYIAAKAPRVGFVKTRLAASIGAEAATTLYAAFLQDLAASFPSASWFVTPAELWNQVTDCYLVPPARVLAQPEGCWTERQRALFRDAVERGEEKVVLVASDSPQLRSEVVAEAFGLLDRHDLVLGPVTDGGYYLIGMRGWHDVLAGIPMSTSSVRTEIVRAARALGLRVALLEPTYDVDEIDDLALLEADDSEMPATRAALAALRIAVPT